VRRDRDEGLCGALRRREPGAAELLVEAYGARAYRLALGITGNPPDAEEAVQDAFWSVIRKIDLFRGESALGTWIYRIVANAACQNRRRGAHRREEISLEDVLPTFHDDGRHAGPIADWSASLHDPAEQRELRTALDLALAELPAGHRALILLHDVEGLSLAEAADALGITVVTAKSRAHRGRLFLRKRLAHYVASKG
jgi:RNA polymerase sigma-70 factor (ECF subfamily)